MLNFLKKLFGGGPAINYKQLVADGAIIVDVRSASEFNAGHIKGALNIPLDSLQKKVADLKKKNKPVITCCQSGMRSGMGKSVLQSAGIECYNGGGWSSLQQRLA